MEEADGKYGLQILSEIRIKVKWTSRSSFFLD